MVKHNAINEYREVVSISFLSLYDAHYFAEGMKVCNLLGASAWQRGLLTSTISCEQTEFGSFPGAYIRRINHVNICETSSGMNNFANPYPIR